MDRVAADRTGAGGMAASSKVADRMTGAGRRDAGDRGAACGRRSRKRKEAGLNRPRLSV